MIKCCVPLYICTTLVSHFGRVVIPPCGGENTTLLHLSVTTVIEVGLSIFDWLLKSVLEASPYHSTSDFNQSTHHVTLCYSSLFFILHDRIYWIIKHSSLSQSLCVNKFHVSLTLLWNLKPCLGIRPRPRGASYIVVHDIFFLIKQSNLIPKYGPN